MTRFTGAGADSSTTNYFTVDHVEWRIRWEYVPSSVTPDFAVFGATTYIQGDDVMFIDMITQMGAKNTNGTTFIHDNEGTFYMKLNIANTESFTIIIEQDVTSIPEFPAWIIAPIFIIMTIAAILIKRKS